jgi:outer membrane protein assembly factor BamB
MTTTNVIEPTPQKPLRLWPGVVIVILQWLIRFVLPIIVPDALMFAVIGGLVGGLAVVLWWLFFSRAPWPERVGAIGLMVVALFVTLRVVHPSIANGMMGMMLPIYSVPVLSLALVGWAVATRRLSGAPRWASMVAAILLACAVFTLLRTGGITGDANSDLHWRWTQTPEERLLAQANDEPTTTSYTPAVAETPDKPPAGQAAGEPTAPASAATETPEKSASAPAGDEPAASSTSSIAKIGAGWPGFRGPGRDGIVRGTQLKTDWAASPPAELWRRPVGPGWSSFAVRGDRLYTQEQRGEEEVVTCYNLTTGKPVWRHRDAARFWESNAGAGPRGTPTLSHGRVYTFGATGILNMLDAGNGAVLWSRNAASDTETKTPGWGFASSPLVVGNAVIVATAGKLVAYDLATGKPRWFGPTNPGGGGYSSPQLATIAGVPQILLLNGEGAISVAPSDGTLLWKYEWKGDGIVQPYVIAGSDVLFGSGSGLSEVGLRRVAVTHGSGGWDVKDRWTSNALKPYYNDFVVHKGHAFGFDGSILACIDLEDGKRKWKGGRYGHGQLLLLPDQDLLLVLSEEGELALVKAASDQFTELARFRALEGKTWNHPVLVGDVLLARNGEQMAAFRLPAENR